MGSPLMLVNDRVTPDECQWEMVPVRACPPQLADPRAADMGLSLKRVGITRPLVEGALRQRCEGIKADNFRKLSGLLNLPPKKNRWNKTGKKAHVTAVIEGMFKDESLAYRNALINYFAKSAAAQEQEEELDGEVDVELLSCLQSMDDKNKQPFEKLKENLEDKLASIKATAFEDTMKKLLKPAVRRPTPPHLRSLIPGAGEYSGIYLVERVARRNYQGFYPGAVPIESHSKTWGGELDRVQSLILVVDWMRQEHRKA